MFQVSIVLGLKSLFGYKSSRSKRGWWHLFNFRCLEYILKIMKSKCMTKLESNVICNKEVFKIRANILTRQSLKRPIKPLVILPCLCPVALHAWRMFIFCVHHCVILSPFSYFSGFSLDCIPCALESLCLGFKDPWEEQRALSQPWRLTCPCYIIGQTA